MVKNYSLLTAHILFLFVFCQAQVSTASGSESAYPGVEKSWTKEEKTLPDYIEFKEDYGITAEQVQGWMQQNYSISTSMNLVLTEEFDDQIGMKHFRFSQYWGEIPVEFSMINVHTRDGMVKSVNGHVVRDVSGTSPVVGQTNAIELAKEAVPAEIYRWQLKGEEDHLKMETGSSSATYYPVPELTYVSKDADLKNVPRLAYKIQIQAVNPLASYDVYIDATDGQTLFMHNLIQHVDSAGVAVTGYSGNQDIIADYTGVIFRLHDNSRGNGIRTYNMQNGTSYANSVDFEDDNNFWNNTNDLDNFAGDAHWGAEMTYDYLLNNHNRNSINNAGLQLRCYVHYGENYSNAFWTSANGGRMVFGDGSNNNPYSTVDITGHEITHGLTSYTASLIYQNESGALNESFSDIFGNAIENYARPSNWSWLIGEDRGSTSRSMSNPNNFNDPDTYQGTFWYTGSFDNGGVHTNSGVQNYWFYLLVEGDSGSNDIGKDFIVQGIGWDKASAIAFRNLTVYLTPSSEYADAQYYGVQSAIDLYEECSSEHESTVNAWYAVGIGDEFVPEVRSEFISDNVGSCNLPFVVNFDNQSVNGKTYVWDFGDGSTSTFKNPSHTYTSEGKYTVTLTVDGEKCGNDEITKPDYINAELGVSPAVSGETEVCVDSSTILTATGSSGDVEWFDDADLNLPVFVGSTFETPAISADKTYFFHGRTEKPSQYVGREMDTIAEKTYSSSSIGLIFDTYEELHITSVMVGAENAGTKKIELRDANNEVLDSKEVDLVEGQQRVDLDFVVPPGTDFQLLVPSSSQPELERSNTADYPYEIPGLVSIKGNSLNLETIYFYFFDWEVKSADCITDKDSVLITTKECRLPPPGGARVEFLIYPNPVGSHGEMSIQFYLTGDEQVTLRFFSVDGKKIGELNQFFPEGNNTINSTSLPFDLRNLREGMYYFEFESASIQRTENFVISGD